MNDSTLAATPPKSPNMAPTRRRARREGAKWTRSGCLTCKRRRKRCDEAKPSCHTCARLGMVCEGYGSMWATPLNPSAGVFKQEQPKRRRPSLSSAGSVSSVASPDDRSLSPASTVSTFPSSFSSPQFCESPPMVQTPYITTQLSNESDLDWTNALMNASHLELSTAVPPSPQGIISHLSDLESHFLQYHVEQGSRLLANLESDENPLRSILIPRAISSPLVMKALCSVSAMHLANRSQGNIHAQTAATKYYIRTMSGLRSALSQFSTSDSAEDPILAVALLCKYEVVRGSTKQWRVHLKALEDLVVSRGGFSSFDPEMAEFLWGLFMYSYNVAKITNRKSLRLDSIADDQNMSLTRLDSYIGYAEDIIKISARISDLPLMSDDPIALGLEIHTIDMQLRTWTHTIREYIIPRGITEDTIERLRMVAECFRDAAFIYLHSTLERMGENNPIEFLPPMWTSFVSVPKQDALERCIERVKSFPLDEHCEYSALTSPLFLVGAETEDLEARELVIASLSKLEINFGIGNVKRAKEALRVLWSGEKKHWLDVLEDLQWDLVLA